jgi:hypothetical protein
MVRYRSRRPPDRPRARLRETSDAIGGCSSCYIGRARSRVRPVDAAGVAVGPNALRGTTPNRSHALESGLFWDGQIVGGLRSGRYRGLATLGTNTLMHALQRRCGNTPFGGSDLKIAE